MPLVTVMPPVTGPPSVCTNQLFILAKKRVEPRTPHPLNYYDKAGKRMWGFKFRPLAFLGMNMMLNRLFREQKGFNLTELMVVIAIIAILVVLAIPIYTTSRAAVKNKSCKGNLRTMDGAIQAYHSDKDEWPAQLSDIVPNFIQEDPKCPWESGLTDCYTMIGSGSATRTTCVDADCPGDASGNAPMQCLY